MYYDTYSTSFQSLMKPMYNVQANYNAYSNMYGMGSAYGMYGMGMGYMSPMMNIGVGQFNADYLVKNDDRNNNYYTRPVAAHVKKDETPTILGILATALGTAALIAGLAKGRGARGFRGRRTPASAPAPAAARVPNPAPTSSPTPAPTPGVNPVNTQTVQTITTPDRLLPPSSGKVYTRKWYANTQQVTVPGRNIVDNTNYNNLHRPSTVSITPAPATPNQVKGLLPQHNQRYTDALAKQQAAMNLPSSGQTIVTPYNQPVEVKGLLPQHNQRYTDAFAKQQAAMNLPSSGQTIVTPYNAASYTRLGKMTPEAQEAYNRVLAQQFKPGAVREMRRADAREAFHPKNAVNEKLAEIKPELMREGKVVYTTHTQPTLQEAYSIGSNAKGADKLAELLKQMQA